MLPPRAGFVKVAQFTPSRFDTSRGLESLSLMPEPSASMPRSRRGVLIWAVVATLAAFVFGNVALLLGVKLFVANQRLAVATASARNSPQPNRSRAGAASPFAALQDSDVAGRYHLFQEGTDVGIVTLLPNHSIINKDGTTFPQYHWEIQPNRLLTRWQAGHIYFDLMPKPGVFVCRTKENDDYRRLEKVEE